jgi:hypothetical protein
MGSSSTRRSESAEHPRSPALVTRFLPRFPTPGRTSNPSSGLPLSQNRQSAPPFSEQAELLQKIPAPSGDRPDTTS